MASCLLFAALYLLWMAVIADSLDFLLNDPIELAVITLTLVIIINGGADYVSLLKARRLLADWLVRSWWMTLLVVCFDILASLALGCIASSAPPWRR